MLLQKNESMTKFFQQLKEYIQSNFFESILFAYLYISQVYYSYRYIFKINSSLTSPSYSDGGLLEKILKYILTILLYIKFSSFLNT